MSWNLVSTASRSLIFSRGIGLRGPSSQFSCTKLFQNTFYSHSQNNVLLSSIKFSTYLGYTSLPVSRLSSSASLHVVSCRNSNVVFTLSLPLASPVAILMKNFYCSEAEQMNSMLYCCTSDADKVYRTIVDSSSPECNLEKNIELLGINLTTALVIEVLHKLHYEEKLAFQFFTWAGHQDNYAHETQAYNEMIDILSNTKYKVKQFRIVCDILDYMKRNNKTLVPVDILLKILRQYTEKNPTRRQKFAKKKKIRMKTQPEINAFNLLLDSFCKCSLVQDAEALFRRMQIKVKPDAKTFDILFFGWCRVRNPTRGMKILDEMIQLGYTPTNFAYNTAIDTFCRAGMVTEAAALLDFMRTRGTTMSSPTARTYAGMIVAFVQSNKMDEAFKLLGEMIGSGSLPDVSTYKEVIEGMCLAGKTEAAYKFLDEMGNKGYPPDIVTYNCFLKVLCENKKREEALRLCKKMSEVGCMPSIQSFNMLITMFFEMGDPDGAFQCWHEMEKKGFIADTDSYCVMIEGLFGCNNTNDASILLEEVVNRGLKLPYTKFDSFLMHLSSIGDLQGIHKLSDHMRKFYNRSMERRFSLNQRRKSTKLREI